MAKSGVVFPFFVDFGTSENLIFTENTQKHPPQKERVFLYAAGTTPRPMRF